MESVLVRSRILAGEAPGAQRIEQRHRVAVRRQRGEQVAPVMPGRLHRHQGDRRLAEQGEQLGIARRILGNPGGFDGHRAIGGHRRHDVTVRSDIDADIAHADPDLLIRRGASPQASTLTLVHARTTVEAAPPDTVRARDAGRGRRSHARGWCLNPVPTTLSQLPVLMLALPLSGWMMVSASVWNLPTVIFGSFTLPHLPSPEHAGRRRSRWKIALKEVHEWLAIGMFALFLLHVAGALKHHFDPEGRHARPHAALGRSRHGRHESEGAEVLKRLLAASRCNGDPAGRNCLRGNLADRSSSRAASASPPSQAGSPFEGTFQAASLPTFASMPEDLPAEQWWWSIIDMASAETGSAGAGRSAAGRRLVCRLPLSAGPLRDDAPAQPGRRPLRGRRRRSPSAT